MIYLVRFTESHELYNNISYFLQDFIEKKLGIPLQDCIVSMQYDESIIVENELFLVEDYGFGLYKLEARNDFIENQKIVTVLGIRTIKDPEKFIEVSDI